MALYGNYSNFNNQASSLYRSNWMKNEKPNMINLLNKPEKEWKYSEPLNHKLNTLSINQQQSNILSHPTLPLTSSIYTRQTGNIRGQSKEIQPHHNDYYNQKNSDNNRMNKMPNSRFFQSEPQPNLFHYDDKTWQKRHRQASIEYNSGAASKYSNYSQKNTITNPNSYINNISCVPNESWNESTEYSNTRSVKAENTQDDLAKLIYTSQKGIQNLGNTCFINSCLQNLFHSDSFIIKLVSNKAKIDYTMPITKRFFDLCLELVGHSNSYFNSALSPGEFKRALGQKHSNWLGYGQQDSQEFCRILLEDISYELNRIKTKKPYVEFKTDNKTKTQCDQDFDKLFRERENSIIIDVFYGQHISTFTCRCGFQSFSFQKLLDIPLLIPNINSGSFIELKHIWNEYFKSDNVQWDAKCVKCKEKTVQIKDTKISQAPECLIWSLQRINLRTRRKVMSEVKFPEELDLKEYIDKEWNKGSTRYSWYGIINHKGTIDFGHYYSYNKINGEWFEFNDSTVSKLDSGINTMSSKAYVWFYKRK